MSTQQIIWPRPPNWHKREAGVEPYNATGMKRLLIRNQSHFVNFADTCAGLMMARAFRRSHPEFKRRHIKPILQLQPKQVPMGEIMLISGA